MSINQSVDAWESPQKTGMFTFYNRQIIESQVGHKKRKQHKLSKEVKIQKSLGKKQQEIKIFRKKKQQKKTVISLPSIQHHSEQKFIPSCKINGKELALLEFNRRYSELKKYKKSAIIQNSFFQSPQKSFDSKQNCSLDLKNREAFPECFRNRSKMKRPYNQLELKTHPNTILFTLQQLQPIEQYPNARGQYSCKRSRGQLKIINRVRCKIVTIE